MLTIGLVVLIILILVVLVMRGVIVIPGLGRVRGMLSSGKEATAEGFDSGDIVSGERTEASGWFSNTLQRRLGMDGAGEHYSTDSRKGTFDAERFTQDGQARNTMWDGYMNRSTLLPQ